MCEVDLSELAVRPERGEMEVVRDPNGSEFKVSGDHNKIHKLGSFQECVRLYTSLLFSHRCFVMTNCVPPLFYLYDSNYFRFKEQ